MNNKILLALFASFALAACSSGEDKAAPVADARGIEAHSNKDLTRAPVVLDGVETIRAGKGYLSAGPHDLG